MIHNESFSEHWTRKMCWGLKSKNNLYFRWNWSNFFKYLTSFSWFSFLSNWYRSHHRWDCTSMDHTSRIVIQCFQVWGECLTFGMRPYPSYIETGRVFNIYSQTTWEERIGKINLLFLFSFVSNLLKLLALNLDLHGNWLMKICDNKKDAFSAL